MIQFSPAEPSENIPLMRFVGGTLEVGLNPFFGTTMHLRIATVGGPVLFDICVGSNPNIHLMVLEHVLYKLMELEPGTPNEVIASMFPQPKIKPIENDPVWQERLQFGHHNWK